MTYQILQSEKMAGIGTLAGGVAHEFNNLIGGMLGYAQLAESTNKIEDYRKCNEVVFQSGQRAKTIIGNLLTFARREPKTIESVRLTELVEQIVSLVRRDFQKENIAISLQLDPDCVLSIDAGQFQQVLLNLIMNGKHAMMEKGGGVLNIKGKESGDHVEIEIADSGVGIPPEFLSRIFEPFFTTKGSIGSGHIAGSGLGLSTSYGIVRDMGGDITVMRTSEEGTAFLITIPKGRNGASILFQVPEIKTPHPAKGADSKRKVLVIDDDKTIRELLGAVLEREGYIVELATNGFSGIEKARHFQPEIAVIDFQMPGLSGKETLEELVHELPDIMTLMITGQVGEEFDKFLADINRLKVDSIQKPFDIEEFRSAVQRLIEKYAGTPAG